ncbi:hypothetical protein EW145_g82 [Phellinidium pouzarii]|uniref:Cytochrome b5 heme-binding domain-containing protein n=1 Tax=Phellinidium pouzarii TaxID=167371 RepID=A0A4S4LJZ0_9AGAM|nr:hypothetical protein EW145_g82 [Phellinidium pouzarii]
MSWLMNPTGEQPLRNVEPEEDKVEDYTGRKVSNRAANRPFLAYTRYREQQKRDHEAWLERKKEREEKLAKGEEVGPEERDPTAQEEVGLFGLLKFIVYCLLIVALAGKFFTGSFLFDLHFESKLPALHKLWPTNQRLFSEEGLLKFDGTNADKPIYLAIDSDVYDQFKAGRDAARAFATGCFATHRTHDIRGLNEKEMKGLEHWKNFFANHKKYVKVGKVLHHPIDPSSPIPEPCKTEKATAEKKEENPKVAKQHTNHEEL